MDWRYRDSLFEVVTFENETGREFIYWKNYRIDFENDKGAVVLNNKGDRIATLMCDEMLSDTDNLYLINDNKLTIVHGDIDTRYEFGIRSLSHVDLISVVFIDEFQAVVVILCGGACLPYNVNIKTGEILFTELALSYEQLNNSVISRFGIYSADDRMIYPWKCALFGGLDGAIKADIDAYIADFSFTTPVLIAETDDFIVAYSLSDMHRLWLVPRNTNIGDLYSEIGGAFLSRDHQTIVDPMTGKNIYFLNEIETRYIDGITLKDDGTGYIMWQKICE